MEVHLHSEKIKGSIYIRVIALKNDFKTQTRKPFVKDWEETISFKLSNEDKQNLSIEIQLYHKTKFFHNDNLIGGIKIDLTNAKDSKRIFLDNWYQLYPPLKKRQAALSPKIKLIAEYDTNAEPVAELFGTVEIAFTEAKI